MPLYSTMPCHGHIGWSFPSAYRCRHEASRIPGKKVIQSWDTPTPNVPHDVMHPRTDTATSSGAPESGTSPAMSDSSAERLAYSVDEAARLTGLSRDLLYDQMRRGKLPYVKIRPHVDLRREQHGSHSYSAAADARAVAQLRHAAGLHHQCHHPAQKSWRVTSSGVGTWRGLGGC
jgi:excisionase family DNA binding protein